MQPSNNFFSSHISVKTFIQILYLTLIRSFEQNSDEGLINVSFIRLFYDPAKPGWEQQYNFEPKVESLVTVMNKTNGTDIHQVNVVNR